MQTSSKCNSSKIPGIAFFRVDLGEFIDGQHFENRMTVRKGIPRSGKYRKEPTSGQVMGSMPKPESLSGRTTKESKWRDCMKDNPYKRLPPLERKPDGTPYRMTPAQRKQANALIRRECCCYDNVNCIALDDGDTCTCPQTISFSVCCNWFRWTVLPLAGTLEAEIYRDRDLKRCAVCGGVFVPKSNRAKYCPDCAARVHRRYKTESERKRRSAVDS